MNSEWGGFLNREFILGIVITTLSFLSVVLIPLIGTMVIVLTPLPVLFYYTKLGRFKGFAVYGISLALVLLILRFINPDNLFSLLFFVFIGSTGIMLAEVLRRSLSIEKTLMIPLAALLTCGGGLLLFHGYQTGQAPWQLIGSYVSSSIRENIKIYEQLDISSEQITLIKEYAGQIAVLLTRIFPAVILVSTSLCLWLNILAARSLFQKHGLYYPDFGDLTHWTAPENFDDESPHYGKLPADVFSLGMVGFELAARQLPPGDERGHAHYLFGLRQLVNVLKLVKQLEGR